MQNVILRERAGLTTATGLRLTVVVHEDSPKAAVTMKEGRYPEKDFEWKVLDNTDGSTTLVIVMYPFYYQPETTAVEFYRNYRFDIEYIASSVTITGLATPPGIYLPGDMVPIDIQLNNSGDAQNIIATIVINNYGTEEMIGGLPFRTLKDFTGDASLSMEWDSNNAEPGHYKAEVSLTDSAGNILDRDEVGFTLQTTNIPEEPTSTPTTPKPKPTPTGLPTYLIGIIVGVVVVAGIIAFFLFRRLKKKAGT